MTDFTPGTFPTPEQRRPLIPVELPEMGGTLYVRRMAGLTAAALPDDDEQWLAGMLIQSVFFADGTRVWETEAAAMAYPMADLKPLITAALDVNQLNGKKVGGIEEKKDDSGPAPA